MGYIYLTEEEIIEINKKVIIALSPKEPISVVQSNSLKALVNKPQQYYFGYEPYPDIQTKSAVLFRDLVKKHVFVNGNKRTAIVALDIFLKKNGYTLDVDVEEGEEFTVAVDTKNLSEEEIATWIKSKMNLKKYKA